MYSGHRYLLITAGGFSHSEISGSTPACGSPELIAANHVLHRLLAPRHPPCALSSLTIKSNPSPTTSACRVEAKVQNKNHGLRPYLTARPGYSHCAMITYIQLTLPRRFFLKMRIVVALQDTLSRRVRYLIVKAASYLGGSAHFARFTPQAPASLRRYMPAFAPHQPGYFCLSISKIEVTS